MPARRTNAIDGTLRPMSSQNAVAAGTFFALAAGLLWGLVFVGPLLLPDYPPALQSFGRYIAYGVIALPLAWIDRNRLRELSRAEWIEAARLGLAGNIVYYLFLASAIQRAGAPVPTMIIGTLPVVIALVSNRRDAGRDGRLPWSRLLPSLVLIGAGIGSVNRVEIELLRADPAGSIERYLLGAALALGAVVSWAWFALRNADWLRAHAGRSARAWASAQGLATLPLALLGYLGWLAWAARGSSDPSTQAFAIPFGPRPAPYLALMAGMGLLASWLGNSLWNAASQRLPTALVAQLIVFETLAALGYAFIVRGQWPAPATLLGIALLVGGVVWALRARPTPLAAEAHPS